MTTTTFETTRHGTRLVDRIASWRYTGGKRDLRIDLLRGIAAFAMIADHIGGGHSWLNPVTGANTFLVSAAEPFVFISGLVFGMVYLNVAKSKGTPVAAMKAFHRAWMLYLVTVLVSLALAAISIAWRFGWAPDLSQGGVKRFILDVVTLHRTVSFADIPLMYTVMVMVAAPVILLLSEGYTWVVLLGSLALWAIWQVSPDSVSLPWYIQGNSVFHFSSWQVLFFTGMVIGWHKAKITAWLGRIPKQALVTALAVVAIIAVGGQVLQVMHKDSLPTTGWIYNQAFNKPNVPILRLVDFGLLMVLALTLTTLFWTPIRRAAGWLLIPLGQSALTAYILHLFLVALLTKLNNGATAHLSAGASGETALQLAGLMAVWLIIVLWPKLKEALQHKVLMPLLPRLRPAYQPVERGTKS